VRGRWPIAIDGWWVNLCGATSGSEAACPTPGHWLLFVLHIPLPTPSKADSSVQNEGLSMQNEGLSVQNGTADCSFCIRVQNGNMIRNRIILRLAVPNVKLAALSKMTHYLKIQFGLSMQQTGRTWGTEFMVSFTRDSW